MRVAVVIILSEKERATRTTWARSRALAARLVTRAKIVLLAAEGLRNDPIAERLSIT
jgi:hypothetical protein